MVDKDLASAVLAAKLRADWLLMLTDEPCVWDPRVGWRCWARKGRIRGAASPEAAWGAACWLPDAKRES